jgi:hypothetical protein|mmetsp:Transcript_10150/g.15353  ORF Transcript_10150/g.15353 Transcript_10150/m.15353 type:complete len:342 (-) Transcript_10150:2477-3502(-)
MAAETATNHYQIPKEDEHCRDYTGRGETVTVIGTKDQIFNDPWQHVVAFEKKDGKSVMSTLMTVATRWPRRQLSEKYQVSKVESHIENSYFGWQERCNNRWKETQTMNGNGRNAGGGEDGNLEEDLSVGRNINTSLGQGENISWLTDPIPKPPWPPPIIGGRLEEMGEKWTGTGKNNNNDHHRGVAEIYDKIHIRRFRMCGKLAHGIGRWGSSLRFTNDRWNSIIQICRTIAIDNCLHSSTTNNNAINNFLDVWETTFSLQDQGLTRQSLRQKHYYLNGRYYNYNCGRVNTNSYLPGSLGDSYQEKLDARARMNDFASASQAMAETKDAPPRTPRVVGRSV